MSIALEIAYLFMYFFREEGKKKKKKTRKVKRQMSSDNLNVIPQRKH